MPVYQDSYQRETSKFSNITFAILPFLSEKNGILSTLESTTFDEIIRCASKWFTLA